MGLHLGHTAVRNYGELSYTDYKLSLSKDVGGLMVTGALVATNANSTY